VPGAPKRVLPHSDDAIDLTGVVTRRRMARAFRPDPVPAALFDRLVDLASRAPSAGKTQGWHLVVLEGDETARFWDVTFPPGERRGFAFPNLLRAPVIALPLADPQAYLDRYSESDKAGSGLGASTASWPAPYWTIDTAMAVMTMLLAAEDAGLGALFFGVFERQAELRTGLGIPAHLELLGAIALGYPASGEARAGGSASRRRRLPDEIIHRGGW
jgi:nitroreductase